MKTPVIVDRTEPLTIVGGGAGSLEDMAAARKLAPDVVAADGGAALCLTAGHLPLAVIGDMDSLDPELAKALPQDRIHQITEQDSTDFDKVLRSVFAPLLIGVGFLGRRVDHQLSVLNRLVARPDKRVILLGQDDLIFLAPPRLDLPLPQGARVSLFPMRPASGTSEGLHWPIDGIEMAPDTRVGTSNRADGPVRLAFERPGMLVLLEPEHLSLAAEALRSAPPWPSQEAARAR